jgi:RNA polymerase sigma-70 factor (ECF subfamily)
MADGPWEGLRLLEPLAGELSTFAPFHLARADMFRRAGLTEQARDAYSSALDFTQNQVERDSIMARLSSL